MSAVASPAGSLPPELSGLLDLVRLLARQAARDAVFAARDASKDIATDEEASR